MRWALLSICWCSIALGQRIRAPNKILEVVVSAGTVGVASVAFQGKTSVKLKLTFPTVMAREGGKVRFAGRLVLFDDKGKLATVDAPAATMAHWCVNDGGDYFRPELTVAVLLAVLPRALQKADHDEDKLPLTAFVVVAGAAAPPVESSKEKTVLAGDADGDGTPEAVIEGRKEEAGCGPALDWEGLVLRTAGGTFDLRCCGP